jgi:hypothetical protein
MNLRTILFTICIERQKVSIISENKKESWQNKLATLTTCFRETDVKRPSDETYSTKMSFRKRRMCSKERMQQRIAFSSFSLSLCLSICLSLSVFLSLSLFFSLSPFHLQRNVRAVVNSCMVSLMLYYHEYRVLENWYTYWKWLMIWLYLNHASSKQDNELKIYRWDIEKKT